MSAIQVTNLTFSYDGSCETIFDHVSFQLDTSWKLGFVGRNGRGKTTFLKLLMGQYEYRGEIVSGLPFVYFPFPVADPGLPALDIVEELCPDYELWQLCRELNLLEVDADVLYRPFSTLSNGEQTKVLLAALFLTEDRFLLIDEPTNHLDMEGRRLVSRYLNGKKGFILVSHDRMFLDGCVDHILSINRADMEIQQGNFSSWWQNKEYRDRFELAENEKLQKEIRRLNEAARRTAGWSQKTEGGKYQTRDSGLRPDRGFIGHKAAKMMSRSKAAEARREKAARQASSLLKNLETAQELKLSPAVHRSAKLAEAEALCVCYGAKPVFEGVSFTVSRGDRLVLQGKNGSGKSSVLKLLAGQDVPHTGRLVTASGLLVSYVPQDASFLKGGLSGLCRDRGIDESLFKAILRKLDFERAQFDKDMADFSAGQKKKTLLAASLCESAHLYLWDEPLNYIDVLSRIQIEALLLDYRPTMVLVEHDESFAQKVGTGFVCMK